MIISDMRAEASSAADHRAVEIVLLAREARDRVKDKSRFFKLRRHLALPVNQRENDYVFALNRYVYHKLALRKLANASIYRYDGSRTVHERYMHHWRNLMDQIEGGFIYELPTAASLAWFDNNAWGHLPQR